jgi:hypothetical protein
MDAQRRELLAALVTGGVAGGNLAAAEASAAAQDGGEGAALLAIREELRLLRAGCPASCPEIDRIRDVQHTHLRAAGKYPDFIEVGTRYWETVFDWLRRQPQPVDATRMADGRYALRFGFTTLVLRPDASADYLGNPTDAR